MKVRIITNGHEFRVQKKVWWWWETVTKPNSCAGFYGHSKRRFDSDESAVAFIRKCYGESTVIVRQWRPSHGKSIKEIEDQARKKPISHKDKLLQDLKIIMKTTAVKDIRGRIGSLIKEAEE